MEAQDPARGFLGPGERSAPRLDGTTREPVLPTAASRSQGHGRREIGSNGPPERRGKHEKTRPGARRFDDRDPVHARACKERCHSQTSLAGTGTHQRRPEKPLALPHTAAGFHSYSSLRKTLSDEMRPERREERTLIAVRAEPRPPATSPAKTGTSTRTPGAAVWSRPRASAGASAAQPRQTAFPCSS